MLNLQDLSPSEGEKNVSLNSMIELSIVDNGTGLLPSSLIIEINGFVAFEDLTFQPGFDGIYSDITIETNKINIVIDKESDFNVGQSVVVKVLIKNQNQNYLNYEYYFKTIPSEPLLVDSSPLPNTIVDSDQIIYLKFTDIIDGVNPSSVNISLNGLKIIINGVFQTPYNGAQSAIVKLGTDLYVRIDCTEAMRNGDYELIYSVEDMLGNLLNGRLRYLVKLREVILPSTFPQVSFFGMAHGLSGVFNVGDGTSMRVEWHKPISRSYKGDAFALIYYNPSRLEIFDEDPKLVATSDVTSGIITGFKPGLTMAFAARFMETYKDTLDVFGMEEVTNGIYRIPNELNITDYYYDNTNSYFSVESTDGYPTVGILILNGVEVVRYTARTPTQFIVPNNLRGLNNTSKGVYLPGDTLKIFFSCQDANTVITTVTPTYADGYASGRELKETGVVVNDYSDEDRKFFQGFDFCGYHQAIPQQVLQGKGDCGSYLGGEFNGFRGMNLFDQMLNREEVLLDQTGEPVILLKRIWDGPICSCMDPRRMQPKIKSCKSCFGTGFEGGYTQFDYKRRKDGRIMVQFPDTTEDLKLGSQAHLEQQYEPQCWTMPAPAIKDRDLIIRFDYTDDKEYIYEVLDSTKAKSLWRNYTRQRLRLKRLDKTDIVYTFPYIFPKQ